MNEIIEALKMVKRMQKDMELVKVLDTVISLLQKKEEQDEATRAGGGSRSGYGSNHESRGGNMKPKQHTPGPWKAFKNKFWIDLSDHGKPIEVDTDENARLIAAAPELLEALLIARDANEELHHLVTTSEERMTSIEALCAIQKAIAKAKGKE